jgi:hypothetical protein
MDRTVGTQEQGKVRTVHIDFAQAQKRKNPATQDKQPEHTTAKTTTEPVTMSSKRFKFPGMTSTKPAAKASKTPLIVRFYDAEVQAKDAHGRTQEQILAWPDSQLESCHNYIQMLFPVPEGSAFNWEAPIIDRETMDTFRARSDLRNRLRGSFERMLEFYGFKVSSPPMIGEDQKDEEKEENIKAKNEFSELVESHAQDDTIAEKTETEAESGEIPKGKSIDLQETTDRATDDHKDVTTISSFPTGPSPSSTASDSYYIVRAPHWRKAFRTWAVRFDHNHLRITRILRCLRVLGLQTECDAFFEALKCVFNDPVINISERSLSYWARAVTRPLYIAPDDDEIEWLQEWEEEQEASKKDEDERADETKGKGDEGREAD